LLRTIIQKNLKNYEDCLSFIEFVYNKRQSFLLLKLCRVLILLTPLDLLFLYVDKRFSFDGNKKITRYQRFAHQDTCFTKNYKWFFVTFF